MCRVNGLRESEQDGHGLSSCFSGTRLYNSRISHQAQFTTCSVKHVVLAGSVCRQYCHKSSRRCNRDGDASFGRL